MATYSVEDVHNHILKILVAIDKCAQEHNLDYFIWAGTMLGAIRHRGFIPWDDDLDIAMPRESYDRLIEHCHEWLPDNFEMVCTETDDTYPLPFAKIQDADTTLIERMHLKYVGGIYIDVFPIDGVPNSKIAQRLHLAAYEYWNRVRYLIHRDPYKHGHGASSWIPLLCRRLYTMAGVQSKIRQLLHKYPYSESRMVADYDDGMRGIIDKAILGRPTPYRFESAEVKGVEQYDKYLSNKYGDYMVIPDKQHQRQHNFHYVDLNKPYREYNQ